MRKGPGVSLPPRCHDAMLMESFSQYGSAIADRSPGRLGILTHDPKQNIRSRLILPFHPRLEQTCAWVGCLGVASIMSRAMMGVGLILLLVRQKLGPSHPWR